MTTTIYIQNEKVDLFQEESVDIIASVLDVSDIKKNTGDKSKDFTVPASKNNNILFKRWFNANIDNGFDARTSVDGRIEIDGIVPVFGNGKFRLYRVNVKKGKATSYTISFLGNLVSLIDVLKKDELKDLDLSAFDHTYNSTNVLDGLTTSTFKNGSIKYTPLVKKQYFYNSDNDNTQNAERANISYTGGLDTGIVWNDLRPAIKCLDIIEAIETKYSGKTQASAVVVNTAPTVGGTAIITLNGTANNIVLTGGLSIAGTVAEIDTAVNLISGYSSTTFFGIVVYIFSDDKERQTDTIFDVGTTTGMATTTTTIRYGELDQGITFTRDFFGTSEFEDLYMWLNPDKGLELGGDSQIIEWDGGVLTYINPFTYVGTYPFDIDTFWSLVVTVTPDVASITIPYQILSYKNGELIHTTDLLAGVQTGGFAIQGVVSGDVDAYFEVKTTSSFTYTASLGQSEIDFSVVPPVTTTVTSTASSNSIVGVAIISENMPKLKLVDFLKGIFDMFKLVIIPLSTGELYVNTLSGYYSEGSTYDITPYIHFDENDIKRGNILNEINFRFEEPSTLNNVQFKTNTGIAYGDEETILYTDDTKTELLDGESLDIKVPFEQIIYDRLLDLDDNIPTDIMYGAIIDEDLSPENPKAHLMYILPKSQSSKSIGFIDEVGTQTEITGSLNIPSHTNASDFPNYSTVFGRELNEWNGDTIENTLYKNHWEDYILAIFNIKKREFQYTANLPLRIVTKLDLNDVLFIKGNYYRIDKYAYNLLTGKTKLNLVNSFDNTINPFTASPLTINKDFGSIVQTVTITNSSGATNVKTDLGFGTAWITVNTLSTVSNVFYLSLTENTTGLERSMRITFTQAVTGLTQTIYIAQAESTYVGKLDFSDARASAYLPTLLTVKQ
mgnify:CR=1 FL=1